MRQSVFGGLIAGLAGIAGAGSAISAPVQIEYLAQVPLTVTSCDLTPQTLCASDFGGPVLALVSGAFLIGDASKDLPFSVRSADTGGVLNFSVQLIAGNNTSQFTDLFTVQDFANAVSDPADYIFNLDGTYVAPTSPGGAASVVFTSIVASVLEDRADGTTLSKTFTVDATNPQDNQSSYSIEVMNPLTLLDDLSLVRSNTGPVTAMSMTVTTPLPTPLPPTLAPVPVPAALTLALTGLGILGWIARRRRADCALK